ncbi:DUF1223 domain-containing protein [Rhodalgimonas zhirmunskyi]|uniref:DUF1223 domain-containing protein n=1 Tax=Rhodalgimonas zhirmunskyi TaxID=2964767 RepID=A0AAJ1UCX4_9RHOB|nr:DUF1223 domain-containing protein [Rhodoalgimonas zhirmunskyi]MDQ2095208.1 DUF1223 domain-containing protein [Rhodoalgimonas zhirmunskyi]
MRSFVRIAALSIGVAAGMLSGVLASVAQADSAGKAANPVVVVELFTSQGCSSCPPADAFLHELDKRAGVLPLSLHVDYWDYIGWKDVFGQKQFTKRQHSYAVAAEQRSVYTPQIVVQGREQVVGNHPKDVNALIARHQAAVQATVLQLSREGAGLRIRAETKQPGPMIVELARYSPDEKVKIRRGENAGKTLSYTNVVREWIVLGKWDGKAPLDIDVPLKGTLSTAVIIQRVVKRGLGPIEVAATLE